MNERPPLTKGLDSQTFRKYYYLKEELTEFCRANGLPASGGKELLTERISHFLDTGKNLPAFPSAPKKKAVAPDKIEPTTEIEPNFVCSEKHRAFFKEQLGESFTFRVAFQKWLKANTGKTYADAIIAYRQIMEQQKSEKPAIDRQFEYNTYIRDFFADNHDKTLTDAICCWNAKKQCPGSHRYEPADLKALTTAEPQTGSENA